MNQAVITIGLFDGVHVGHRAVIEKVVAEARADNDKSIVVTFDRHPADVLQPGHGPLLLTDPESKTMLIKEIGADKVMMIEFTPEFAALSPQEFLDTVVYPLRPRKIIVGKDFKFGRGRAGDVEYLRVYAKDHGFCVEDVPLFLVGWEKASSSLAREYIRQGYPDMAREILGRYHFCRGIVVPGEKRGSTLGFPTANVEVPGYICLPREGVYSGAAIVTGASYPAVINIGHAPTFVARQKPVIEAYLLDFDGDLYGQSISVEFHTMLREERKFADAGSLAKQIAIDAKETRNMVTYVDNRKEEGEDS